ncbi:hypothetical protein [Mycolicibacterium fortuitum]|uniref:Uncharacterized protein n=2 Tax=Mycolicibacterium fortuitum TaxID=1766 RepID=A0AAE4VET5_MYCFO|nr:hypothetical protein [Mycolicibacterium fortuitum]MCV7142554.1 hypothetical protein [Mycolicibacterium fortuitum]MDV7193729.1 hypothetical protein [Mycolicibacterium fortuitum]MDV7207138.1 hypothetical protein [Mycolicibacterium fortuitum]MDV7228649.1 hypothetical protein [Mycolicibacterium fortuitum]MDV7260587.1 hypothetical protein [Mycolicibacterium fortuitum]
MKKGRFASSPTPPPTPPPAATPAQSAPAPSSSGAAGQSAGGKGFGAAFRALVERKFRELTKTQRWQGVSEAKRRAEARRRGAAEMGRRLERQTGKRPAASTVTRNASKGSTPKGADQQQIDRQAAIDRAGGIKQFAAKAKISAHQARRWRDTGGPIHTSETIVINFNVTGDLQHGQRSENEPETLDVDKHLVDQLTLDGADADDFIEAYAADDIDAQKEILGEQIATQILSDWNGDITRIFTVRTIITLSIG